MPTNLIKSKNVASHRVLAIDPTRVGFGFVVLEGTKLLDWGLRSRGKTPATDSVARAAELMERSRPHILVIENTAAKECRRGDRAGRLLSQIAKAAVIHDCKTVRISRNEVCDFFSGHGGVTKRKIAEAIADSFPTLASRMPPPRRPWMREDERMSIFDAAALAITFLAKE
jgi:hypothetical protein